MGRQHLLEARDFIGVQIGPRGIVGHDTNSA